MNESRHAQPVIAFDIEVAGYLWEEVDETTRGYLLSRARDEHDRAAVPERTGLYPGLGKIIAIGMWLVREDRGMILLEGAHAPERDFERVKDSKIFRGDEKQVLERFWQLVGRASSGRVPRLVSFVDQLPKSGSGKVMWRLLQEQEQQLQDAPPQGQAGPTS